MRVLGAALLALYSEVTTKGRVVDDWVDLRGHGLGRGGN